MINGAENNLEILGFFQKFLRYHDLRIFTIISIKKARNFCSFDYMGVRIKEKHIYFGFAIGKIILRSSFQFLKLKRSYEF